MKREVGGLFDAALLARANASCNQCRGLGSVDSGAYKYVCGCALRAVYEILSAKYVDIYTGSGTARQPLCTQTAAGASYSLPDQEFVADFELAVKAAVQTLDGGHTGGWHGSAWNYYLKAEAQMHGNTWQDVVKRVTLEEPTSATRDLFFKASLRLRETAAILFVERGLYPLSRYFAQEPRTR